MGKAERKIHELVGMIENGELQLPEMQREYVWSAPRVRDLLDSLYRGYPSGVILAWESDEVVKTRKFAIAASKSDIRPLLLLDGQQRLTSLSAVLRGESVSVRGRKTPIEILFNLEHPEELNFITDVNEFADTDDDDDQDSELDIQERFKRMTFVVASRALESLPNWVRVTDIMTKQDAELLPKAGITGFDDPRFQKYVERLKAVRDIKDYVYRMDILERSKSYEEVTEIFVRVNSLGAKLRSSDLALAQITAKWNGSLELFRDYQDLVEQRGFRLDLGVILRVLVALVTSQSKFQSVNSIKIDDLKSGWVRAQKAFDFALNFAKQNLDIDSDKVLSSPALLITTAYWADKANYVIDDVESGAFKQWFLVANAKGRYSRGSSETLLDQDLAALRDGGHAEQLMSRLRQQVGRLDFSVDDLIGRKSNSSAFKTMFLAFRHDNARDWKTNLKISAKHHGKSDVIEFHHVFPKAYLRENGISDNVRVDDIANLAFIGSETNKKITNRAPSVYKGDFSADELAKQLVNLDEIDEFDRFEEFLQQRRQAIADRLNRFLGLVTGEQ
jgi:hypothetical protein